jgi:hypothetical protein
MSLFGRLRSNPQPTQLSAPTPPAGPDPDATAVDLRAARERIELLEQLLAIARAAERRAIRDRDTAEQRLADLTIAEAGDAHARLARALKALTAQADLLEGCRRAHGSNVAASSLPAVTR